MLNNVLKCFVFVALALLAAADCGEHCQYSTPCCCEGLPTRCDMNCDLDKVHVSRSHPSVRPDKGQVCKVPKENVDGILDVGLELESEAVYAIPPGYDAATYMQIGLSDKSRYKGMVLGVLGDIAITLDIVPNVHAQQAYYSEHRKHRDIWACDIELLSMKPKPVDEMQLEARRMVFVMNYVYDAIDKNKLNLFMNRVKPDGWKFVSSRSNVAFFQLNFLANRAGWGKLFTLLKSKDDSFNRITTMSGFYKSQFSRLGVYENSGLYKNKMAILPKCDVKDLGIEAAHSETVEIAKLTSKPREGYCLFEYRNGGHFFNVMLSAGKLALTVEPYSL